MRILAEVSNEESGEYDDISDKMMAASGILKTIGTLFLAVDSSPDVLRELEKIILPICVHTMEKNLTGRHIHIVLMHRSFE